MSNQLYELSRRFPDDYVGKKGDRNDLYINHAIIKQRLIEVCGGYNFKVVREIADADGTVTGCYAELTVEIDGTKRTVGDYGDVEHNQGSNGSNSKHCASDAFKRCASHLGLGLHVWADKQYFLEASLNKASGTENEVGLDNPNTNRGGTSNSETPTTSNSQDQVDGLSPLSDSTNTQDEPPADLSEFDKKLERIKKEKVENAEEHDIDPRTGGKITYKHDK